MTWFECAKKSILSLSTYFLTWLSLRKQGRGGDGTQCSKPSVSFLSPAFFTNSQNRDATFPFESIRKPRILFSLRWIRDENCFTRFSHASENSLCIPYSYVSISDFFEFAFSLLKRNIQERGVVTGSKTRVGLNHRYTAGSKWTLNGSLNDSRDDK